MMACVCGLLREIAPCILGLDVIGGAAGGGGGSPALSAALQDCELTLDNVLHRPWLRVVEKFQSGRYSKRQEGCVQSGNVL